MAIVAELKQSTATTLLLGQFLDETDGKTAETGLTISQADVLLWKEGGTTLAQKNESTSCTHRSHGLYTCPVDTTDTNTLGVLSVSVIESGALPIRQDYKVITAEEWNAKYSTTGDLPTRGVIDRGTAQSATGTTLVLRSAAVFADDTVIGATLAVYGSTQAYWQTRTVTDYVLSTDTATVDTWTVTPSGTITYVLFAGPPASATLIPAVNATQFAGQTITAAAGVTLPSSVASPTNITAGTITTATNVTTVNGLAANVITAAATAADFGAEVADAILNRDMATGTDSGSTTVRTVRQALRALRNKVSFSGGTATVTKEDDSTASWTAAVTGTPTVTAVDPAGP